MVETEDEVAARRIGKVIGGKWKLDRLIGTGGMAAVYAATGPGGQQAAVKILHPEMALRRDVRERFLREAYVANKVDHIGAVAVLEHGNDEEAYLVMELLEGEPLSDRAKRLGGIPVPEMMGILDQVLDVLACAHDRGLIHRDIKPDNLFVCSDGRVEVLDFGLARMLDEVPGDFKTRTGLALGTLPYMAPEQALGRRAQLDGRADIFALGATAFRILARRKVHEADSEAELLMAMATQPAPPLASVATDVPRDVCAIVDLALAFNKDARYPDARTMQADVRAALAGQPPPYAVGQGVQTKRDEPTRVDMVAPVSVSQPGAYAAMAMTSPGAYAPDVGPNSMGPSSMGPSSMGPSSFATTMTPGTAPALGSAPPPAAEPKRSTLLPLVLLALGFLIVLGIGGIALVIYNYGDEIDIGGESSVAQPQSTEAPVSAPATSAPAAQTASAGAEPEPDGIAPDQPTAPPVVQHTSTKSAAPTATAAPKATTTTPPRATATATATAAVIAVPPPTPPPDPGKDKGKGKGKGKDKDKGKGR